MILLTMTSTVIRCGSHSFFDQKKVKQITVHTKGRVKTRCVSFASFLGMWPLQRSAVGVTFFKIVKQMHLHHACTLRDQPTVDHRSFTYNCVIRRISVHVYVGFYIEPEFCKEVKQHYTAIEGTPLRALVKLLFSRIMVQNS